MLTPSLLSLPAKFSSYWNGQSDTILSITSSLSRFILLDAPTGAGKSIIYISAAQLLHARTLILTSNKGLQSQLLTDFSPLGLVDIRGHANYPCGVHSTKPGPRNLVKIKTTTAKPTTTNVYGGWSDYCRVPYNQCEYVKAVELANQSRLVITNYAYWLTLQRVSEECSEGSSTAAISSVLGDFDLLICDEAHTAADWLSDFTAFKLDRSDVRRLLSMDLPTVESKLDGEVVSVSSQWLKWVETALISCRRHYKSSSPNTAHRLELEGLGVNLASMLSTSRSHDIQWVIERTSTGIKLTPVWASYYAEQYLFRGIPKVILASATLARNSIIKYLGIPHHDHDYIEVPSTFPVSRRPFIYLPTTRVDKNMLDGQKKLLVNRMDRIIEGRLDVKGIVQPRSYARAEEVANMSTWRDFIITHKPGETAAAVDLFKSSSAPCILISPAIEEGYDFPDDECRYQIILKVPFIDTRDPITKARCKSDRAYANYLAGQALVQQVGRGMRSATDWCETFILDEHWAWFFKATEFPKWFKDTWRIERKVPTAYKG